MDTCKVCAVLPHLLGKKLFLPLLGHNYKKITREEVTPFLDGLDLKIVGGLEKRGYTKNDIDLIGEKKDVQILAERLLKVGVVNPLHYCGGEGRHSHLECALNGIKLAFSGKGY